MSPSADPDFQAARAARRRRRQSRQAVIFGTLILFLAACALGGTLIATETVASPFKQNFTVIEKEEKPPEPWCPQGDMLPVDPTAITVNSLNGTKIGGLGNRVAQDLESRGFNVAAVDNAKDLPGSAKSRTTVEIHYGPSMANEALTLAAHFKGAVLWPDESRVAGEIDVVGRKLYSGLIDLDQVGLVADQPLKAPANCRDVPANTNTAPEAPAEGEPPAGESNPDEG